MKAVNLFTAFCTGCCREKAECARVRFKLAASKPVSYREDTTILCPECRRTVRGTFILSHEHRTSKESES
jgi:hypothetical protein